MKNRFLEGQFDAVVIGAGHAGIEAALAAARTTGSAEERRAHLRQAEQLMLESQPVIPLYWSERTYLKSPAVSGWYPLLLDNHPLDAVKVNRK